MLMFNPCEETYGPWKCIFIVPISQRVGPLELSLNLQDSTSIECANRKHIKEPYLQVFAFWLSEFTGKTWDLKRFGNLPLPEIHVTDWYELMLKEIGNSVWPPEHHTNPQKSLAWSNREVCMVFTREMRCLPEEKSTPMRPQVTFRLTSLVIRMLPASKFHQTGLC
jgi:hypothetical protein